MKECDTATNVQPIYRTGKSCRFVRRVLNRGLSAGPATRPTEFPSDRFSPANTLSFIVDRTASRASRVRDPQCTRCRAAGRGLNPRNEEEVKRFEKAEAAAAM